MQPGTRVAGQMGRLISEMSRAPGLAVKQAAIEAKRIHLAEITSAAGSDLKLSGVGRSGARVGVAFKFNGSSGAAASAFIRATGPLHFIENPSKPHVIRPRARRALATRYGPRARVNHPGVRNPRRPWARARPRAIVSVSRIVRRQYGSAFARGVR